MTTIPENCYYMWDGYAGKFRWWQEGWFADQFDLVDKKELDLRIRCANLFCINVFDHLPEYPED